LGGSGRGPCTGRGEPLRKGKLRKREGETSCKEECSPVSSQVGEGPALKKKGRRFGEKKEFHVITGFAQKKGRKPKKGGGGGGEKTGIEKTEPWCDVCLV